jgi:hypothetical protein
MRRGDIFRVERLCDSQNLVFRYSLSMRNTESIVYGT